MTNYNIPYYPVKTEAQKEEISRHWKEYWAVPGNREAWYEAMSEGQDEEWLAKVTAKNQAQAQDPKWREGQRQNAIAYWNSLSDDEKSEWSQVQKDFWNKMSEEEYARRCAKAKEVANDPVLKERLREELYDTPEYREYIQKRSKKIAQRPEMQEWYKEFNKAKREDPEHVKRHAKGVKDRSNKNKEWIRKNCRPVDTPYGVFEKAKDVMDIYHQENGGNRESVAVKLRNWLKSDKKPEWKYLTWEEYDTIVGGD